MGNMCWGKNEQKIIKVKRFIETNSWAAKVDRIEPN